MQDFTDKEILGDGLSTQKSTTEKFNTFAGECVHDDLRGTMMKILEQEHSISTDVGRNSSASKFLGRAGP